MSVRKKRGGVRAIRMALVAVLLLPLLWVVGLGVVIYAVGQQDDSPRSDAIVVLGAAQYDGRPSPVFRARLDHAYQLYERGRAPVVIVTGGKQPGDQYTEGQAGTSYLHLRGIPWSHLVSVGEGNNTLGSLRAVARRMRSRQLRSAILVSDRFHIFRSERMASDLGLVAHGSPTTTSPIERNRGAQLRSILHEIGGFTAYLLGLESD